MISIDASDVPLTSRGMSPHHTAGSPEQFSATIATEPGLRSVIWRCEPGDFPWRWENAETFHVIEGEGTITDAAGQVHEIHPGRIFAMTPGDEVQWHVTKTILKLLVVPN